MITFISFVEFGANISFLFDLLYVCHEAGNYGKFIGTEWMQMAKTNQTKDVCGVKMPAEECKSHQSTNHIVHIICSMSNFYACIQYFSGSNMACDHAMWLLCMLIGKCTATRHLVRSLVWIMTYILLNFIFFFFDIRFTY